MNSLSFSKIFVFLASELHWKYRWSTWAFDVWFHMEVFHHSFHEKVSLFLTVYSFYLSPWTYMLYLTCHNFTRELHKQSCHWCVCICLWEGPSVNLQFIMILFANIYCKMLKNTQEKMFWYVFLLLNQWHKNLWQGNAAYKGKQWNKAVNYYSEAIKLNGKNATYYSNRAAAYLQLGWYDSVLDLCFTLILLYWELALPFDFNACSFQKAEEDCNRAISLDKKVTGQIFAMIFIFDWILVAIYHSRTNQILWCSLWILG
jgi:tetratricopeptide (TPR) repeat protein